MAVRITVGPTLAQYRQRIAQARALLAQQVPAVLALTGANCAQALSDAAPRGADAGEPPPGDAPGALADSFTSAVEMRQAASGAVRVRSLQPTKLRYVREGTGLYGPRGQRIRPATKKALYWRGADHPVRSVAGQRPNDFVSPITAEAPETLAAHIDELALRVVETLEGGGS